MPTARLDRIPPCQPAGEMDIALHACTKVSQVDISHPSQAGALYTKVSRVDDFIRRRVSEDCFSYEDVRR